MGEAQEEQENNEGNQIPCLQENGQDNIFSIVEKSQKDLMNSLFQRVQANPEITKELLELLEVIEDDHKKWRHYKRERASAHHRITLEEISVELKNFQNRKKEYSKYSVQGIMAAVFSGEFKKALFNPCLIRQNSKGENVILAGHSRNEAFNRLDMIYKDKMNEFSKTVKNEIHELCEMYKYDYKTLPSIVQTWCKKHDYYFDKLPCLFIHNISFDDAQTIALMSNALGTAETDIERACVYRQMRISKKTWEEIEIFGKQCEKNNRSRIKAYSYLNPNGKMTCALDAFEKSRDDRTILEKIAIRIGNIRKKHPDLSDLHEDEIYSWLLNQWGYGTSKGQIKDQVSFMYFIDKKIQVLKLRGKFAADKMLNIAWYTETSAIILEFSRMVKEKEQAIRSSQRELNKAIKQKAMASLEDKSWIMSPEAQENIKKLEAMISDLGEKLEWEYKDCEEIKKQEEIIEQYVTAARKKDKSANTTQPNTENNLFSDNGEFDKFIDFGYIQKKIEKLISVTAVQHRNAAELKKTKFTILKAVKSEISINFDEV